jgi:adenylate kinase
MGEHMNIILFGPQGSGKGTQADFLAEDLKLYHLSMGEELRKEIKGKTAIGKKVESIMAKGELVPVEITSNIILNISKQKESKNGMILDGYPRSAEQWTFANKNLKFDAAIELHLSEKESIRRIASRRMCPKCGKNYNIIFMKPKVAGQCDIDNTKLVQRDDDKPEEIKKRLEIYHSQTEPLKKEYKKLGILHIIDGEQPIETVHKELLNILKKK